MKNEESFNHDLDAVLVLKQIWPDRQKHVIQDFIFNTYKVEKLYMVINQMICMYIICFRPSQSYTKHTKTKNRPSVSTAVKQMILVIWLTET